MRRMLFVLAVFALLVSVGAAQKAKQHAASAAKIARGKYLVEDIGKCADCHSPRNEKGEFIKAQWLMGTALDFKPAVPMPVWADKSPNIAGLPGWENYAAIRFFMTGIGQNNLPPRPPMPQYRYNQQDAEAVVAYLKSLEPAK